MGKSKNKNSREIEYLRGQIRKLEAELKYYKKLDHAVHEDIEPEDMSLDVCEHCGKGIIVQTDLGRVRIRKCGICDWREVKHGKT